MAASCQQQLPTSHEADVGRLVLRGSSSLPSAGHPRQTRHLGSLRDVSGGATASLLSQGAPGRSQPCQIADTLPAGYTVGWSSFHGRAEGLPLPTSVSASQTLAARQARSCKSVTIVQSQVLARTQALPRPILGEGTLQPKAGLVLHRRG